jgi:hypothetical protein
VFAITAAHVVGGRSPISFETTDVFEQGILEDEMPGEDAPERSFDSRIALFRLAAETESSDEIDWKPGNLRFVKPLDSIGQAVIKKGATTGVTTGTVVSVSGKIRMLDWRTQKPTLYNNVIEVEPEQTSGDYFAQPGDSGALVITESGGVLGVVIGGYGRKAVVAPLYELAAREQLRLAGQKPIAPDDGDESAVDEIRRMLSKCYESPEKWHEYLTDARKIIATYFTNQHRRFGLEYMESIQDRLAIRLLSIVGIENFASGIGKLHFLKDAPGPVPSDNWLLRSTIERQRILEFDSKSSQLHLAAGVGDGYSFDESAPVEQWTGEIDLSIVDKCLGVNSFS